MSFFIRLLAGVFAVFSVLTGTVAAKEGARVILVLDASGSMWGQIDGLAKMDIAKQTVGKIIGNWRAQDELGLVVYGHREKGSCSDIEVVRKPGSLNKQSFMQAVNGLVPKGKTPMTDAVRMAAQSLKFTEKPATVILVSDGIETCASDPCAIASELEKLGVKFTVHTVGFNVASKEAKRQLRCIAENTGGKSVTAENAKQLEVAIREVVKQAQKPVEPPKPAEPPKPVVTEAKVHFQPVDAKTGREINKVFNWSIINPDDESVVLEKSSRRSLSRKLKPGKYRVIAEHRSLSGAIDIDVASVKPMSFDVPIKDLTPKAELKAPEKVVGGSRFKIEWSGPGDKYDSIALWDNAARNGDGKQLRNTRISSENNVRKMIAPSKSGVYELRYYHYKSRKFIATKAIEVSEVKVSISAPKSVVGASKIKITWEGPGQKYDHIELWDPSAKGGDGKMLRRTRINQDHNVVKIVAPTKPGQYELRYFQYEDRKHLATVPIEITKVDVSLKAPATAKAAFKIRVDWVGPGNKYDHIELWDPNAKGGDGKLVRRMRINQDHNVVKIVTPAKPGKYELRYYQYEDRKHLVSVPIEIEKTEVSVSAPATVKAGNKFKVVWKGPGQAWDSIILWDPNAKGGDGKEVGRNRINQDVETVKMTAPKNPGSYELRYFQYENRVFMATSPLKVTAD